MKTLYNLYEQLKKHVAILISEELSEYCEESKIPETERSGKYHFGKNSLKWFFNSLSDTRLDDDEMFDAFYQAIAEAKALELTYEHLNDVRLLRQTKRAFWNYLKQKKAPTFNPKDLNKLEKIEIQGFTVVLNPTQFNITRLIFSRLKADLILATNNEYPEAAFILRSDSKIVETGLGKYIFDSLQGSYHHWASKGEPINLVVSKDTVISLDEMKGIILYFFNKQYHK